MSWDRRDLMRSLRPSRIATPRWTNWVGRSGRVNTKIVASRASMNSRQWLGGRESISPGKKELRLAHQAFDQKAAKQFRLDPRSAGLLVIFWQAAKPQETFEMLEAKLNLPADSI